MPAIPAFPEGTYPATLDLSPGAGFVADAVNCTIVTYSAQGDINFGVAVQNGTTAGTCVLGVVGSGGSHPTDFLGFAVMDQTGDEAGETPPRYNGGEDVAVLIGGTIVVANSHASDDAVVGDPVGLVAATGAVTTDVTTIQLTGAQWLDAAASGGGLGRIRLIATPQA
jgi:hypothetical protein